MRVVLAPLRMLTSLSAPGCRLYSAAWVADCLARGWRAKRPGDRLDPLASPIWRRNLALWAGGSQHGQHYIDLLRLSPLPADITVGRPSPKKARPLLWGSLFRAEQRFRRPNRSRPVAALFTTAAPGFCRLWVGRRLGS